MEMRVSVEALIVQTCYRTQRGLRCAADLVLARQWRPGRATHTWLTSTTQIIPTFTRSSTSSEPGGKKIIYSPRKYNDFMPYYKLASMAP